MTLLKKEWKQEEASRKKQGGRREKEEGTRKKGEGRREKEEGRRKKEEGRRKKEFNWVLAVPSSSSPSDKLITASKAKLRKAKQSKP